MLRLTKSSKRAMHAIGTMTVTAKDGGVIGWFPSDEGTSGSNGSSAKNGLLPARDLGASCFLSCFEKNHEI